MIITRKQLSFFDKCLQDLELCFQVRMTEIKGGTRVDSYFLTKSKENSLPRISAFRKLSLNLLVHLPVIEAR